MPGEGGTGHADVGTDDGTPSQTVNGLKETRRRWDRVGMESPMALLTATLFSA